MSVCELRRGTYVTLSELGFGKPNNLDGVPLSAVKNMVTFVWYPNADNITVLENGRDAGHYSVSCQRDTTVPIDGYGVIMTRQDRLIEITAEKVE